MVGGFDWLTVDGFHNAIDWASICVSVRTDAVAVAVKSSTEVVSIWHVSIDAAEVLDDVLILEECSQAGDAEWISVNPTLIMQECKSKGKCKHSNER